MKRKTLVLDEHLLEQATQALGVKTYSAAVNLALAEALRIKKLQELRQSFGKGLWQGNLSEMERTSLRPNFQRAGRARGSGPSRCVGMDLVAQRGSGPAHNRG